MIVSGVISAPMFLFFILCHCSSEELFFAIQANWQYSQKGSDTSRSWSDRSQYTTMLHGRSKGRAHVRRGMERGYSTTQRASAPADANAAVAAGSGAAPHNL